MEFSDVMALTVRFASRATIMSLNFTNIWILNAIKLTNVKKKYIYNKKVLVKVIIVLISIEEIFYS